MDIALRNPSIRLRARFIRIYIRNSQGRTVSYKILRTCLLDYVMNDYCNKVVFLPRMCVKLMYQGEEITGDESPESLGLRENTVLYANIIGHRQINLI